MDDSGKKHDGVSLETRGADSGPAPANVDDSADIMREVEARYRAGEDFSQLLRGFVDGIEGNTVNGWAYCPVRHSQRLVVEILIGDAVVSTIAADRYREDLIHAGIGDGFYSFACELPQLAEQQSQAAVRVRIVGTTIYLPSTKRGFEDDAAWVYLR